MSDFISVIVDWFKNLAKWVEDNLGDPYIAQALRDDLDLAPGDNGVIDEKLKGIAAATTFVDLSNALSALKQIGEQLNNDPNSITGWDVAYLLGKLFSAEMIRAREPIVYTLGKACLFISNDPESWVEFDPAVLFRQIQGEKTSSSEELTERISSLASLLAIALELVLDKYVGPKMLDAYYGWDPAPKTDNPLTEKMSTADLVSSRAMTLVTSVPIPNSKDLTSQVALTILGVPKEHGGPGLFLSLGGQGNFNNKIEQTTLDINVGATNALNMLIGWGDNPKKFAVDSKADTGSYGRISLTNERKDSAPIVLVGDKDNTRLTIKRIKFEMEMGPDQASVHLALEDAELVIRPGEGDGFLKAIASSDIKLGFSFGITIDTHGGVRIDNGTCGRAIIPVEKSLGGFLDIHTVELALTPTPNDPKYSIALEMTTAFGLNLGPFRASVDRIGLQLQLGKDINLGFKAPNGIGIVLDTSIVKGGGYLFFDEAQGEYAGALELRFSNWGIKAIGVLTTKMPDGSSGWALQLLLFVEGTPHIPIGGPGLICIGIGGVIGLHHGVDIPALQEQMPKGVLDDILFPQNPIADAPRIINRMRIIFPIRRNAFLIGLMFKVTWGSPPANLAEIKLGLVLAMDNALGGDRPTSISKILMLGQIRIGMPETARGDVIRIIVDFLGYLDFDAKRFGFYASLRDSRLVQVLELTGSLLVLIDYGDHPTFLVAVGGFHPRFKDLPSNLPIQLDRIGVKFTIASIIELTIKCYFAVTSATIQFGVEARAKIDLDVVEIEGYIGFDALIYYHPRFRFEVDFRAGMTIKVMGETLLGVSLEGILAGPGRWRISGKAHFSILCFDFDPSFDEQWGTEPNVPAESIKVAALLETELSKQDNWSIELPAGAETWVTLEVAPGETRILAHPSSQLRVTQKIAPLGLTMEKFGEATIDGPNRFDLESVSIGNILVSNRQMAQEHLARSQYLNLSEEQKLSSPSFESFDVGVTVGINHHVIPLDNEITSGNLNYETKYLVPEKGKKLLQVIQFEQSLSMSNMLTMDLLQSAASAGAAAQSKLREKDRLRPDKSQKVSLSEPSIAVVDKQSFTSLPKENQLSANNALNWTLAHQTMTEKGLKQVTLVENYELVN